jgi:hypothetical protein
MPAVDVVVVTAVESDTVTVTPVLKYCVTYAERVAVAAAGLVTRTVAVVVPVAVWDTTAKLVATEVAESERMTVPVTTEVRVLDDDSMTVMVRELRVGTVSGSGVPVEPSSQPTRPSRATIARICDFTVCPPCDFKYPLGRTRCQEEILAF